MHIECLISSIPYDIYINIISKTLIAAGNPLTFFPLKNWNVLIIFADVFSHAQYEEIQLKTGGCEKQQKSLKKKFHFNDTCVV